LTWREIRRFQKYCKMANFILGFVCGILTTVAVAFVKILIDTFHDDYFLGN
jgi:capsular polysaccharide biosynthesis protein